MSIPVELPELAQAMTRYRFAYLLTGTDHGAPHAVAVSPVLHAGVLTIQGVGRRTGKNLASRPEVGLVWPPADAAGYSLIVDGTASVVGEQIHIQPTRAVLHRSAPSPEPAAPDACGSDCKEITL